MDNTKSMCKSPILITVLTAILLGSLLFWIAMQTRENYRNKNKIVAVENDLSRQEGILIYKAYYAKGREIYSNQCAACHGTSGEGSGEVPPHNDGTWLTNERLGHIIHFGLKGQIKVNGKTYNSIMPPVGTQFSNKETAALMTFIQNSFGNKSNQTISSDNIKILKKSISERNSSHPMTSEELLELKNLNYVKIDETIRVDSKTLEPIP